MPDASGSEPGSSFLARAARILFASVLAIASFLLVLFGVILMLEDRSAILRPELFLVFSAGLVLIGAGLGYAAFRIVRRDISAARALLAEQERDLQRRHEEQLRKGPRRVTGFELGLVLLLALGVGWAFAPGVVGGLRSMNWPLVEAKVIDSRLVERTGRGGGKFFRRAVTYSYVVDGRTYTSDRSTFGVLVIESPAVAEPPTGATVQVAVNPADARDAVLEPGASWLDVITLIFPLLACITVFVQAVRSRRWRVDER